MALEVGKTLNEVTVKTGLRELNPDIHFDMGTKLGMLHPFQAVRQGVFVNGNHVCSMDRGDIPEFKVWTVADATVPCSLGEADQDDVIIKYEILKQNHPGYWDLYDDAVSGRTDDYRVRHDGNLMRIYAVREQRVPGRVFQVGWRHTFEKMMFRKVPGITREALNKKFDINMYAFPVGTPEEVMGALIEE